MSRQYGDDVIGLLKLNIHSAKLERDTEMVGKMDPYIKFFLAGQEIKETAKLDGAGKEPVWNETIEIQVKDLGAEVKFSCWDDDGRWSADDLIGEATESL